MSLEEKLKSVIIIPDVHLDENVPKDYLIVKKFISKFKPDEIILLGDFMDVSSLSGWDLDKKRKMENRRWVKELSRANKELDFLQKHCKKLTYLEGNHEDRIERYLDKNPEMEGLIEITEKLNLKERGIKWVKMNKLYKCGDMYFTHGMWTNKYSAQKHLAELGCNICFGHQHKTQTAFQNQAMAKPMMAYALGTLGDKAPDYLRGRPGNWICQFGVMYYNKDSGNFNLYPINVIKGKFLWNGNEFK